MCFVAMYLFVLACTFLAGRLASARISSMAATEAVTEAIISNVSHNDIDVSECDIFTDQVYVGFYGEVYKC